MKAKIVKSWHKGGVSCILIRQKRVTEKEDLIVLDLEEQNHTF